MPLEYLLNQNTHIPRRKFLKYSIPGLMTVGNMLINPLQIFAAGEKEEFVNWGLLTDTHIHKKFDKWLWGYRPAHNLKKSIRDIVDSNIDATVITGDIACSTGKPEEYKQFFSLISPLKGKMPVYLALGNHDNRDNYYNACKSHQIETSGQQKHTTTTQTPLFRAMFLDSLDRRSLFRGRIGEAQIKWLIKELDTFPEIPTILFLHHYLNKPPSSLKDSRKLLRAIKNKAQVKALFFGHSHRWHFWEEHGIHLINLPALGYHFRPSKLVGWTHAQFQKNGVNLTLNCIEQKHRDHKKEFHFTWR